MQIKLSNYSLSCYYLLIHKLWHVVITSILKLTKVIFKLYEIKILIKKNI